MIVNKDWKLTAITISVVIILIGGVLSGAGDITRNSSATPAVQERQVTLTVLLEDQGEPARWNSLLLPALDELRGRHPDMDIQLKWSTFPYAQARTEMLRALTNQTPIDLISLDQIWLGEFAGKSLLTNLTDKAIKWGRSSDWYQSNWDGGLYHGDVYAIWAWTDVRGIWYWKDLLNQSGVDPNSMQTWDGYIAAAKKLNAKLEPLGIEGVHLTGASHSPDLWYPYLWMLGGDILKLKDGHPTKGTYWFPAFNSSAGVEALQFIKDQVNAGIKPQKNHYWGIEFLDRKFAVMIEALQHHIREKFPINSTEQKHEFERRVGFIPMFPVPSKNYQSTSLMGGWEFGIPKASTHKDLAWELLTILVEPKILAPYLALHSNLPTQIPIGEGPYARNLNQTTPYYDGLITMLKSARYRPSIPEFPQIADNIRQAIEQIYNGTSGPRQALDDAAYGSAKILGW